MLTNPYYLDDICNNLHENNLFDNFEIGNEDFNSFIEKCKEIIRKIFKWFKEIFYKFCSYYKTFLLKYTKWVNDNTNKLQNAIDNLSFGFESVNKYYYDFSEFIKWCNITKIQFIDHTKLQNLLSLCNSLYSLMENCIYDPTILDTLSNKSNKDIVYYLFGNNLVNLTGIPEDIIKAIKNKTTNYTHYRSVKEAFKDLLEPLQLNNVSKLTTNDVISGCKLLITNMSNIVSTLDNIYGDSLISIERICKLTKYDFKIKNLSNDQVQIFTIVLELVQSIANIIGNIIQNNVLNQFKIHKQICDTFLDCITDINYNKKEICLSYISRDIEEKLKTSKMYLGVIPDTNIYYFSMNKLKDIIDDLPISEKTSDDLFKRLARNYGPLSINDPICGALVFVNDEFINDLNKNNKSHYLDITLYHEYGHILNADSLRKAILERKSEIGIKGPMLINYSNSLLSLKREYHADAVTIAKYGKELVMEVLEFSLNLMISKNYIKSKSINRVKARLLYIKNNY